MITFQVNISPGSIWWSSKDRGCRWAVRVSCSGVVCRCHVKLVASSLITLQLVHHVLVNHHLAERAALQAYTVGVIPAVLRATVDAVFLYGVAAPVALGEDNLAHVVASWNSQEKNILPTEPSPFVGNLASLFCFTCCVLYTKLLPI